MRGTADIFKRDVCKMDTASSLTVPPTYSALVGIVILLLVKLLKYIYRLVLHVKTSKCVGKVGQAKAKMVVRSDAKGLDEPADEKGNDKHKHSCKNQQ